MEGFWRTIFVAHYHHIPYKQCPKLISSRETKRVGREMIGLGNKDWAL